MATVQVDPSNQLSGLAKTATGIIAGVLVSKAKLQPGDANLLVGSALSILTVVWQILHRKKVARAQAATAAAAATTDPEKVSELAKAA